jgi:NADH dehydrogenase [ubiquinone] 1 alpha subcomplex assembly factor 1
MKFTFLLFWITLFIPTEMESIYSFTTQNSVSEWRIVNDGVMGGISKSSLLLTSSGHGKFAGHVSLANNGGFASIQLNKKIGLTAENKFVLLKVKGDGKQYEFRIKAKTSQNASYVHPFSTSGEWQLIKLPLAQFYPQFFGRILDSPNFNFQTIEQLSFLIANKREEDFELLIDFIGVE